MTCHCAYTIHTSFLYLLLISFYFTLSTATTIHTFFPQSTRPFVGTDIRINYFSNSHSYQNLTSQDSTHLLSKSISELSTSNFSTLSRSPPESPIDTQFTPFGDNIRVQFRTSSIVDGSEDNFTFILSVDRTVISTDVNNPTHAYSDDKSNIVGYQKRVTYVGTRLDDNGQEETLVIAIRPNGQPQSDVYGDYTNGEVNIGLETLDNVEFSPLALSYLVNIQSRQFEPLSNDVESGRHDNGFTIEGLLMNGNGKQYQISTYRSLLFQQISIERALLHELNAVETQITNDETYNGEIHPQSSVMIELQHKLDKINNFIQELYLQRVESSYDLALISTDTQNGDKTSPPCGVDQNETNRNKNNDRVNNITETNAPLQMIPTWSLTRWVCHSNQNKRKTILTQNIWVSVTFQMWASGVNNIEMINYELVDSYVQFLFTAGNLIVSQQWESSFSYTKLTYSSTTQFSPHNPEPGKGCPTDPLPSFKSIITSSDVAFSHNFIFCPKNDAANIGSAIPDAMCQDNNLSWSMFKQSWRQFVDTWLHEIGHTIGLEHSNEGSIMSPSTSIQGNKLTATAPQNDHGHTGFHIKLDNAACVKIDNLIKSSNQKSCLRPQPEPNPVYSKDFITACNHDGITDIFEECDAGPLGNKCCSNCRITDGAICLAENECCVNCQPKDIHTICKLPADQGTTKSGYCQSGICRPLRSPCETAVVTDTPICTVGLYSANICRMECRPCSNMESGQVFPLSIENGINCGTDMYCQSGECVKISESYSWRVYTVRECSILDNVIIAQMDTYHCLDSDGKITSASFCQQLEKPKPTSTTPNCVQFIELTDISINNNALAVQIVLPITVTWNFKGSSYYDVDIFVSGIDTPLITVPGWVQIAIIYLPSTYNQNYVTFTIMRSSKQSDPDYRATLTSDPTSVRLNYWKTTEWADCKVETQCGLSMTTRSSKCTKGSDNSSLDNSQCDVNLLPYSQQQCTVECPGLNTICNSKNYCQCQSGFKSANNGSLTCVSDPNHGFTIGIHLSLFITVALTVLVSFF